MRLDSTVFKEALAVVVISHGIFLTGFTYSFGEVKSKQVSVTEEGFTKHIYTTDPQLSLKGSRIIQSLFIPPPEGIKGKKTKRSKLPREFNALLFYGFRDSALNSVGCLLSAYTIEILGRKRTIQLGFLSFLCAGVLFLMTDSTVMTSVSHAISAISLGTKPVFIIYVLEVSQKNHRGMFISFYLIFGSFGFASSYALQYFVELKSLAAVSILIAVAGFCGTTMLPDTKYWYLMHNQIDKAKDSSSWFNRSQTQDDIDKEMDRIRSNTQDSKFNRYQNFLVATALLVCRAGSGKVVFALYPASYYLYFETNFLVLPMPLVQNLAAFVLTVVFTAIIDQFKRRQLLYFSTIAAISALICIMMINLLSTPGTVVHAIVQPIVLLLYGAIIDGFLEGLITVLSAEIISAYDKRGALLNASYICSFILQILYAVSFPYVINYFNVTIVLLIFLVNDIAMLIMNIFCISETSNKELDEFGLFVTSI